MKHLEDLIREYNFEEVEDEFFLFSFRYWARRFDQDPRNPKHESCLRGKIEEYFFVKESKFLDLPFEIELNYGDPFGPDLWLKKSKYEIIPADHKKQRNTIHPARPNPFDITGENFTTLRRSQIDDYCEHSLKWILIDRDVDMNLPSNRKVRSFVKRFDWPNHEVKLESKRNLVIVEVEKLCRMIERNEDVIFLVIPEEKRYHNNNGKNKFNGETIGFNYEVFSHVTLTQTD